MTENTHSGGQANGAIDALPNDGGNVDKIRDILFGSQMRDYDRRFADTEQRLQGESANLREDLGRRMLATEQYLRGELETLSASVRAEERDRVQGVREALEAVAQLNRDSAVRFAALADLTAQQQRELRALLQEAQRTLGDEIVRRHGEVSEALRRESVDLRLAKADRVALAAMFAEFAQRLANEPDGR